MSAASLGEAGTDTQSLAKQAQNPIANLISIPVQSNTNFGVGANHGVQEVLYIQPVIQNPLGVTMTPTRRADLLRVVEKQHAQHVA